MQAGLNGGWFLNMFVLCDSDCMCVCLCTDTAGLSVLVLHHRDEFLWFFTVQCGCRRKTEGKIMHRYQYFHFILSVMRIPVSLKRLWTVSDVIVKVTSRS